MVKMLKESEGQELLNCYYGRYRPGTVQDLLTAGKKPATTTASPWIQIVFSGNAD